jgi:hypothetical protein
MRHRVKIVAVALALIPTAMTASPSGARPELADRLPAVESGDFARAAMRAQLEPAFRKRPLALDFGGTKPSRHFHFWTVIPTWGQGLVYYYVDRRTGDVWAALGCERVRSRELAALQAKFRRRFHVSAQQVRDIEREGFPYRSGCP